MTPECPKGPQAEAQIEIQRLEENEEFLERAVHLLLGCCDASDVPCEEPDADVLYDHLRQDRTPCTMRVVSAELDLYRERDTLTRQALQHEGDGPLQFAALAVRQERDRLREEVSRLREQLAAQQPVWAPADPTDESARLADALRFVGVVDPDDDCMSVFDTTGEGIKHWVPVDAIALRMLEHMGGVSSSEVEAPQPVEHEIHMVTCADGHHLKCACGSWWCGEEQDSDFRAEQHIANNLRPQVKSSNHQANQHDEDEPERVPTLEELRSQRRRYTRVEGRPSGSGAAAPHSVTPPAQQMLRDECRATEGATGIECSLSPGHHEWYSGRHTPRTDGTESLGYPLNVQWPRQEWDRCAPEAEVWRRGDPEPSALVSAVRGFSTGNVYTRRLEGFGGPWDYETETSDGWTWSTWEGLLDDERGAELPDARVDAAQAARSEATPHLRVDGDTVTRYVCSEHIWGEVPCPNCEPREVPSPSLRKEGEDTHVYLSTACLHGQCDYCVAPVVSREGTWKVAGPSYSAELGAAKNPARCKFCSAPCRCGCHQASGKGEANG